MEHAVCAAGRRGGAPGSIGEDRLLRGPTAGTMQPLTCHLVTRCYRAVLALGLVAFPSMAQVSSGSLLGDVRDEKAAAVAGVSVMVRNADTGFSRAATTNPFGSYRIDNLL